MLDFVNNKTQQLTLGELKETYHETYPNGQPVGDIFHFDLIETVMEKFGHVPGAHIRSITAVNNRDKFRPGVTVIPDAGITQGESNLRQHILRRIHTVIDLGGDSDTYDSVGITWHQLGFVVALGLHVRICDNGCIFGARNIVANYTLPNAALRGNKTASELVGERIAEMAAGFEETRDRNRETVRRLQESALSEEEAHRLVGRLQMARVTSDMGQSDVVAPLTQAQLNRACERLDGAMAKGGLTAWDFLQAMNTDLNPNGCTANNILLKQYEICEFVSNNL